MNNNMIDKDKNFRLEILSKLKKHMEAGELNNTQVHFLDQNKIEPKEIVILNSADTKKLRSDWENIYLSKIPPNIPKGFSIHQYKKCYNPSLPGVFCYGFNWHVFSFNYAPHKKVKRDFLKTFDIPDHDVILMWEDCHYLAIDLSAKMAKAINFLDNDDIYIFPRNCSWTFVTTHEDVPFSPSEAFYSRKEWIDNTQFQKNK